MTLQSDLSSGLGRTRTHTHMVMTRRNIAKLLNKLSVSQLAQLSKVDAGLAGDGGQRS